MDSAPGQRLIPQCPVYVAIFSEQEHSCVQASSAFFESRYVPLYLLQNVESALKRAYFDTALRIMENT